MPTYNKNDPATIQAMFNNIARQYDKTNAVLSFQMHKIWNKTLIREVIMPAKPKVLLDLCSGTGAIAFEYLQQQKQPLKAYLLDFSEGMLAYAKEQASAKKLERHKITFLQADAQKIPLTENSIDCATIAYGIRNVKQPLVCIKEVYRVLKPGGSFGILELTQPTHPLMRFGHRLYLQKILPIMGKLLTSDREAYSYLCNSINTFIPPQELERLMREANFKDIQQKPLFGGIATLISGKKPKRQR